MLSALFKQFINDVCYKPLDRLLLVLETKFSGIKFIGRAKPDSLEHYSRPDHIISGPCLEHYTRTESSFPFGQQCMLCGSTVSNVTGCGLHGPSSISWKDVISFLINFEFLGKFLLNASTLYSKCVNEVVKILALRLLSFFDFAFRM
jgi:hypothetical protein